MPRHDTGAHGATRASIAVSSILLVPICALAFFALRPHKAGHARFAWYLLALATICLAGSHIAFIAMGAYFLKHDTVPDRTGRFDAYFALGVVLPSGFELSILGACRAAFWEITAPRMFKRHDHGRWVTLAFDLLLLGAGVATMISTAVGATGPKVCWESPCDANNVDFVVASLGNAMWSYGFQYMIILETILVGIGAFFARKWSRIYNLNVSLANAMFSAVVPVLAVQAVLLLVAIVFAQYRVDEVAPSVPYYASIPYWVQQVVVAGFLLVTLRRHQVTRTGAGRNSYNDFATFSNLPA
ncbi:hypothetical protein AURDEDRAFT_116121 [Auricularia subglabra TFB-10046 SS5]|uniref:Uncharacterized protein n=1 Tax=Auricularia subglabra (strain TFB-10046 / SS5) TaxID=717982 RepID=J0WXG9_AURST|nr:hypothetical protein AURDEDRAFT_116121 [Auricularia subglabra TFB-10046 SS5]